MRAAQRRGEEPDKVPRMGREHSPQSERQHRRMAEFIYTMKKVRKAHGDKVILDDVTLSFYPGAKIGVVGPNGAGKSSVLRIMAGLDKANNGEAFLATMRRSASCCR